MSRILFHFQWHNLEEVGKTSPSLFLISSRKELTDFLQQLKDSHGKSVSRLTFDEIVYKISQMIEPKKPEVKQTNKKTTNFNSVFFYL